MTAGIEPLRQARAAVERAHRLLASPSAESLDGCAAILSAVCADLADRYNHGSPGGAGRVGSAQDSAGALAEARRLQESVRRISWLHAMAQEHYARWSRTISALTSGYTPGGEPAPLSRATISCTG